MITNQDLASLAFAWDTFQETGHIDELVVRPEVARSWRRCKAIDIDPYAAISPPQSAGALNRRASYETRDNFVDEALPFLDFLTTAVRGSGFLLVITDHLGVVLRVFGDADVMSVAERNNYVPGVSRAESEVGTNSICVAIAEREAIQLTGAEHWNVRHHRWTCASAPVLSPSGELLGTITLSGESISSHPHTLGMVMSAAEAVGDQLKGKEAKDSRLRLDSLLSSLMTAISDAIVTIDGAGAVTHINSAAAKLAAVSPHAAIGKSVQRIFPGNPELIEVLNPAKEMSAYEVTTDGRGGRGHLALTPYRLTTAGKVDGAILVLRERKEFLNEVREISGFHAVFRFDDIIGESPALVGQIALAKIAAQQSSRVLITGETGTGKELFAQAIHNGSPRRNGPFVAVNCAAIPRELLESELFGYKGGAFTGSRKGGQVGKLELADGGTIFLDEVNQMPLDLQSKLLRVLQDSTVTRLGDERPIRVDVRVLTASNEDLYEKSRAGEFRQDLYFRLCVVELCLPPLRERPEDIPRLAATLLEKIAGRLDRAPRGLSGAAIEHLAKHHWPGNIRELENVLEMASIICEGTQIEPLHLMYRSRSAIAANQQIEPRKSATMYMSQTPPVRDVELEMIRAAMREMNGNVAEVSRKLGISRSTIYRRMKEHGIIKSVLVE